MYCWSNALTPGINLLPPKFPIQWITVLCNKYLSCICTEPHREPSMSYIHVNSLYVHVHCTCIGNLSDRSERLTLGAPRDPARDLHNNHGTPSESLPLARTGHNSACCHGNRPTDCSKNLMDLGPLSCKWEFWAIFSQLGLSWDRRGRKGSYHRRDGLWVVPGQLRAPIT